jgi:glycine oxidase
MRVTVVGGGIVGLSIAWRLVGRGADVTVLDDGERGAWYVAAGMLAPGGESVLEYPPLGRLMRESADRWPSFAASLADPGPTATSAAGGPEPIVEAGSGGARAASGAGFDGAGMASGAGFDGAGMASGVGSDDATMASGVGFDGAGTLSLAMTADDVAEAAREWKLRGLTPLRPSELREREPNLSPRVRAGAYAPDDRQVDPRKVVAALRRRLAGRVVPGRVASTADVDGDAVVVAAGCGTAALTGLPVRPVKGQVLRLRAEPGLLTHVVTGLADGREVYLVPRADGEIVVGATQEERTDALVTAGGVYELLRSAIDLLPGLAEAELAETTVGHRPGTPDNAPLLGRLDERVVVAAGHHRNGVLLAPVTADLIAGLVLGDRPDPLLDAFSPQRFR